MSQSVREHLVTLIDVGMHVITSNAGYAGNAGNAGNAMSGFQGGEQANTLSSPAPISSTIQNLYLQSHEVLYRCKALYRTKNDL